MNEVPKHRGGKRKGAGRKPQGKARYTVTLTETLVHRAKKMEGNFSGLLDRLLSSPQKTTVKQPHVITMKLNTNELAILFRQDPATKDNGGWQRLIVTLQELTDETTGDITIPTRILERIQRYAFNYGNGGWEDRLTSIFGRTLGEKLTG